MWWKIGIKAKINSGGFQESGTKIEERKDAIILQLWTAERINCKLNGIILVAWREDHWYIRNGR